MCLVDAAPADLASPVSPQRLAGSLCSLKTALASRVNARCRAPTRTRDQKTAEKTAGRLFKPRTRRSGLRSRSSKPETRRSRKRTSNFGEIESRRRGRGPGARGHDPVSLGARWRTRERLKAINRRRGKPSNAASGLLRAGCTSSIRASVERGLKLSLVWSRRSRRLVATSTRTFLLTSKLSQRKLPQNWLIRRGKPSNAANGSRRTRRTSFIHACPKSAFALSIRWSRGSRRLEVAALKTSTRTYEQTSRPSPPKSRATLDLPLRSARASKRPRSRASRKRRRASTCAPCVWRISATARRCLPVATESTRAASRSKTITPEPTARPRRGRGAGRG